MVIWPKATSMFALIQVLPHIIASTYCSLSLSLSLSLNLSSFLILSFIFLVKFSQYLNGISRFRRTEWWVGINKNKGKIFEGLGLLLIVATIFSINRITSFEWFDILTNVITIPTCIFQSYCWYKLLRKAGIFICKLVLPSRYQHSNCTIRSLISLSHWLCLLLFFQGFITKSCMHHQADPSVSGK